MNPSFFPPFTILHSPSLLSSFPVPLPSVLPCVTFLHSFLLTFLSPFIFLQLPPLLSSSPVPLPSFLHLPSITSPPFFVSRSSSFLPLPSFLYLPSCLPSFTFATKTPPPPLTSMIKLPPLPITLINRYKDI